MLSTLVATIWLAARLLSAQAPQTTPTPPAAPAEQLVPGQLPANVSEAARAAWNALCRATEGDAAQPKVFGFQIRFDGTARPVGRESHDFNDASYRYLEPGWIHTTLADGQQRMRGPRGDYFVKDGVVTRLQGRDFENDRRELDEQVRIAHNFVNLIHLRPLRMSALAVAAQPPPFLPSSLVERATKLLWLDVTSPDFEIGGRSNPAQPTSVRAWIGRDPVTHLPELAIVARDDRGTLVHETALLVRLDEWKPLDGFKVPFKLRSYEPDLTRSPWAFAETAALSLWIKDGTLRPSLGEADFVPPEAR